MPTLTGANSSLRDLKDGPDVDSPLPMDPVPTDIASRRREQIVTAAKEIIAREGIHRFSLGRLEKQVGMARGHLTYYFPTKEAILLAVFDKMLADMKEQMPAEADQMGGPRPMTGRMGEALKYMFRFTRSDLPAHRDFLSLVWTFYAQMNVRPDFRDRLAMANREWRTMIAADYTGSVSSPPPAKPETVACIVMALITGLDGQLAADPQAFDRDDVARECIRLLAPLFPEQAAKVGAP
ncbi:MAG: TetR/AcrR family transcriptional regulator [Gemmataceae bacterium]